MLFLASAFWGLSIPVMKALGVEQARLAPSAGSIAGSLASLGARFGLAALLVAALSRTWPWSIWRQEWKHGSILGLITAVSMFAQVDGLNYTTASTAGFLIALYSIIIPIFTWVSGRRPMTWVLLVCCVLVSGGMATLTGADLRTFSLGRGELESLAAALLFSLQILWIDGIKPGTCRPGRITFVLCGSVSVFSLAALCVSHGGFSVFVSVHASMRSAELTLILAAFGTAAPFLIMNRFQSRVGPVTAGFLYCFEPIASAAGALFLPEILVSLPALYPNESISPRLALGGALILAANLLLLRDSASKPP